MRRSGPIDFPDNRISRTAFRHSITSANVFGDQSMKIASAIGMLICTLALAGPNPNRVWETSTYEGFREGTFDSSGANLYVSRKGIVQTIHRFDVNQDGYFDLVFSNTHDRGHRLPAFQYRMRNGNRQDFSRREYPGA